MRFSWLYLLLILTLLIPGASPRLVSVWLGAGTASPTENAGESETEEEEVREGVTTSRHRTRFSLDLRRPLSNRPIPQFRRIATRQPAASPVTLSLRNGFGGLILC